MDKGGRNNSLIYLIHIQKTAGTSIRFYFEKCFGAEQCLWHAPNMTTATRANLLNVANSDPDRFSRYRVIGGHVGFSKIPKAIMDRKPIFVSAVRNPVARIISHYQHIRNAPNHGLHDQVAGKTLFQAMKSRGFAAMSDRVQIEYLCGHKETDALREAFGKYTYIIGKQEKMPQLFRYLSRTFELPEHPEVCVNVGDAGYEREIEAQADYAEAVSLIRYMNKEEYEFCQSFDSVWSNFS